MVGFSLRFQYTENPAVVKEQFLSLMSQKCGCYQRVFFVYFAFLRLNTDALVMQRGVDGVNGEKIVIIKQATQRKFLNFVHNNDAKIQQNS